MPLKPGSVQEAAKSKNFVCACVFHYFSKQENRQKSKCFLSKSRSAGTYAILCPNNEPQDPFSKNPVKSRVLDMRTFGSDVRI